MFWVWGKKFISEKQEQILERYKPPQKATLLKSKVDRVNSFLKKILNSEIIIKKLYEYRDIISMYKINVYDAIDAFLESNKFGYYNRHDFSTIMIKLLIKYEVIDQYTYDKKNVDDTINKIFSIFNWNMDGIVGKLILIIFTDAQTIALGCTFLCSGSIGDRVKVLFKFFNQEDSELISYSDLQTYFHSWFVICFKGRNDFNIDIDLDRLAHATTENLIRYTK